MIHWRSALQGLDDDQRQLVADRMILRSVNARAPIFEVNDQADTLYVVSSGRIRLIYRNREGAEFTTGVWTQGYVVGLISAFLNEKRFLAAESLEHTELLELSRQSLQDLMHEIPGFAINIAEILGRLAHDSILRSGSMVTQPAANRLANILVRLALQTEASSKSCDLSDCNSGVIQGLTQEDLARLVGVSRPWINTTLAYFEDSGLIRRHKKSIEIVDVVKFQQMFPTDYKET